ncbi:peptidylprolyl isomerase [uncultured Brevundimonas sp.]|uniref:peptidylprolyl isomerase n=1 Tax=uncultured Brevundimonas sp. TaxID=213418 RepID=UPI00260F7EB8|nr:peptidylprolyl isomerase [uncultured Brevundimonas sp.]
MKKQIALALAGLFLSSAPAIAADEFQAIAPENLLVIETTKGDIYVEMTPDVAPLHVERIRALASAGFYDGVVWHRVIDGFMAQTGDPTGTGEGGSALGNVKAELTFRRSAETPFVPVAAPSGFPLGFHHSLPVMSQPDRFFQRSGDGKATGWGVYCPGVAGMARDEAEDSADSQFFLMRAYYPTLERRYSIWGRVVVGQDVVDSLNAGDLPSGMVESPDRMTRVRIAADIPVRERPVVRRIDPASARFAAHVADVRAAKGADFSVCDITIEAQLLDPMAR